MPAWDSLRKAGRALIAGGVRYNDGLQPLGVWRGQHLQACRNGAIQNVLVTTFDTTRRNWRRAEREKPLILLAHPSGVEPETF